MRKELGKYLLDVSKLIFAGLVINAIFNITEKKTAVIVFGLVVAVILCLIGLFVIKKSEQ